jgi:hypothetical protein
MNDSETAGWHIFDAVAERFIEWVDRFNPSSATHSEVVDALDGILDKAMLKKSPPRPGFRNFKPNTVWQEVRRRFSEWHVDGYFSTLPNDDETPLTLCSLAYDIADFREDLEFLLIQKERRKWLSYLAWPYVNQRIREARDAVVRDMQHRKPPVNPFQLLSTRGRRIRFATWRTSAITHATEDAEEVDGVTTLCGGVKAFHKHTQQQWSCYSCHRCRDILHRS